MAVLITIEIGSIDDDMTITIAFDYNINVIIELFAIVSAEDISRRRCFINNTHIIASLAQATTTTRWEGVHNAMYTNLSLFVRPARMEDSGTQREKKYIN